MALKRCSACLGLRHTLLCPVHARHLLSLVLPPRLLSMWLHHHAFSQAAHCAHCSKLMWLLRQFLHIL